MQVGTPQFQSRQESNISFFFRPKKKKGSRIFSIYQFPFRTGVFNELEKILGNLRKFEKYGTSVPCLGFSFTISTRASPAAAAEPPQFFGARCSSRRFLSLSLSLSPMKKFYLQCEQVCKLFSSFNICF